SVPYSLYAEQVDMGMADLNNVDLTGLTPGQSMVWDGTNWVPGIANTSVWSQTNNTAFYNSGRVGIGENAPATSLHMADTSNLLIGDGLTGSGFKMLYYGAKGAFRVGFLNNPFGGYNYDKFWDYDSVGFYSFAAGQNARAKGFGAFAFGSFGWADGTGSVAFFGHAEGNNSFTFGGSSRGRGSITFEGVADDEGGIAMYGYTGGRYGVSIGGGTTGLGASSSREDYAIAIGWNSDARGQASIALGPSDAYGYNAFSTGWVTEARGNYSSTFGYQTNSYPYASMALGRFNAITGDSASWVNSDPIFIIGDGTSNNNRSNSFMIQKNGQTAIGYNTPTGFLNVSTALGSLNNGGLDMTNAALLVGSATNGIGFDANQMENAGGTLYLNFNSTEDISLVEGGGQVAIGHNTPAAKLDIEDGNWQLHLDNPNAGGNDFFIGASDAGWGIGGDKLVFSRTSASTEDIMVLADDLQVGIGVGNPSDRLHLNANTGENALRVQIAGGTKLRVNSNGGLSVGDAQLAPVNGLFVKGLAEFDNDVRPENDALRRLGGPANRWLLVYAVNGMIQTSDFRLKKDIQPLSYGLETVMQMRPVSYQWKATELVGDKIGLIAQELYELVPEVVAGKPEEKLDHAPMGVNYAELVPVLIKAIQDQQEQIEMMDRKIQQLQQVIDEKN
ncbi:MAG: tail fiber domain-containing protein, partial [Bacteroidota bacterium]